VVDGMKNLVPLDSNLIRLQKIINLNFKIDELNVQNSDGKKIGKIKEYVFNDSAFEITKIYVAEKSLKSKILDKVTTVKRSQVAKISNQRMIVSA
jgi:sporulation protein YlmC with PRC-barrel domain